MHDLKAKQAEVHLTYRCDLACPSCNRACFYKRPWIPDLTMLTFIRLMDEIDRLGFLRKLVIIGGEPTLHPSFMDFLQAGYDRGFEQVVYSNGYSARAKSLLEIVKVSHLAKVKWSTLKQAGSDPDLGSQTVFCAPRDLPQARVMSCDWMNNPSCGYSVDELGYTPCPPAGMISYWQCPQVRTQNLADLLDESYKQRAFAALCPCCGAFIERGTVSPATPGVTQHYNTLMTKSWLEVLHK